MELCLIPDQYLRFHETIFLEYTLYQNWLKDWYKWNSWYYLKLIEPSPSLEDLFNPPISSVTWKRHDKDNKNKLIIFGLLWTCWDLGDGWNLGTVPPCLETRRENLSDEPMVLLLVPGRVLRPILFKVSWIMRYSSNKSN